MDSKVCHSGILDNDAVGDLNLLPREREKGEWGAGETITWVYNKLPQPVELFCRQASKPSTRNATDVESDPLEPCGTVQVGRHSCRSLACHTAFQCLPLTLSLLGSLSAASGSGTTTETTSKHGKAAR